MKETLQPWHPIEGTEVELFLETVSRGLNELEATLSTGQEAERTLVVNFGWPIAYRVNSDHIYMQRPWWGSLSRGSLYSVKNSTYSEWLKQESQGIYDNDYAHYFIISVDGCLDVLTLDKPTVHWRGV